LQIENPDDRTRKRIFQNSQNSSARFKSSRIPAGSQYYPRIQQPSRSYNDEFLVNIHPLPLYDRLLLTSTRIIPRSSELNSCSLGASDISRIFFQMGRVHGRVMEFGRDWESLEPHRMGLKKEGL
jgi:hypothetical protein